MLREDLIHKLEEIATEKNSSVNEVIESWIKVYRYGMSLSSKPSKEPFHVLNMSFEPIIIVTMVVMFFVPLGFLYLLASVVEANLVSESITPLLLIPIILLTVCIPAISDRYRTKRNQKQRDALLQQILEDDTDLLNTFDTAAESYWQKEL